MGSQVAPISVPWLAQMRLDLGFLQPIAKAMDFSPARRPAASGLRQHPEYWRNLGTWLN